MNQIQFIMTAVVLGIILILIGYYWYQEAKFRRMVENNFNQKTGDALMQNETVMIFSGESEQHLSQNTNTKPIVHKDIFGNHEEMTTDTHRVDQQASKANARNSVLDQTVVEMEDIPEDSVEALFAAVDKINFQFAHEINNDLDFVVDIVFEENQKLKVLPDIAQFTSKAFEFYVLDRHGIWYKCDKIKKYTTHALKLVVQMADNDGLISQAQLSNIYNELYRFVIANHAHIRKSDYESAIEQIRLQIAKLAEVTLDLELYLIIKDKIGYPSVAQFLKDSGFIETPEGSACMQENRVLFTIADEDGKPLERGHEYRMLSMVAKLHMQTDPLAVVDTVFDFAERFISRFESRILSANKMPLEQKDYEALMSYITDYVADAKRNHIQLGSALMHRLYTTA